MTLIVTKSIHKSARVASDDQRKSTAAAICDYRATQIASRIVIVRGRIARLALTDGKNCLRTSNTAGTRSPIRRACLTIRESSVAESAFS